MNNENSSGFGGIVFLFFLVIVAAYAYRIDGWMAVAAAFSGVMVVSVTVSVVTVRLVQKIVLQGNKLDE